ncbi:glycosyltransferase family 25 protein [Photobacterium nomapromontoriensis]|uniref:glycosyltransferase family 25 protein n=1 Tax=Photobacterium nomapromontoriensis TaxID=2910237 RepID=UPI003D0A0F13
MIDIFVVNLETSTARKASISARLDALGLNYHIFPAVDGRVGEHPLFQKYRDDLSQHYRGKSLSKGQLGCYASHYLLWEKCIELNKPIIVLEDDALFNSALFSEFCEDSALLPSQLGFIRLHKHQRKKYSSCEVYHHNNVTIHRFSKGQMGTIGYYLTPDAAKQFLNHSQQWIFPVDIMMDRFWATHVECYGLVPECVLHDDDEISDIGYGKKAPRSLLTKCKREWFNLNEFIQRETHNLHFKFNKK